jgi:WD40 repeat protein
MYAAVLAALVPVALGAGRVSPVWRPAAGISRAPAPESPPAAPATAHRHGVHAVAFSEDGGLLASGGADGLIRLWHPETGAPVRTLGRLRGGVYTLRFLPDPASGAPGRRLLSVGFEKALVWDVAGRRTLLAMDLPRSVQGVAASDRLLAVSSGEDNAIALFELATGARAGVLAEPGLIPAELAFTPDGRQLAAFTVDTGPPEHTRVTLWDLDARQPRRRLEAPGAVHALAFSGDGALLAAGQGGPGDGHVTIWDVAAGRASRRWRAHSDRVPALAFSPDGHRLYTGARFGFVASWPVEPPARARRFPRQGGAASALALSPDGRLLAQADGHWATSRLLVWDAGAGRLVWSR